MTDLPSNRPFGAVLTAMVTPFTPDGGLDLQAAQHLARRLIADGNDGLVVSGTTGEAPTTTDAEKTALLRAVLEAVGDRARVIAGAGTNDTRHSVELAEQAAKAGAHGLLVVTPYYNKPPTEGLIAHFTAVADATELPVMLYDIPGRTGTRIGTPALLRLSGHPRIVAVKDATGDLCAGAEVMSRTPLRYYSGDDLFNLAWLAHGAAGVVSVVGHLAAARYAAMVAAVDGGDLPAARRIHAQLIPVVAELMNPVSQGAIRVKAALQLNEVLEHRQTRLPLLPAPEADLPSIRAALQAADLLQKGVL